MAKIMNSKQYLQQAPVKTSCYKRDIPEGCRCVLSSYGLLDYPSTTHPSIGFAHFRDQLRCHYVAFNKSTLEILFDSNSLSRTAQYIKNRQEGCEPAHLDLMLEYHGEDWTTLGPDAVSRKTTNYTKHYGDGMRCALLADGYPAQADLSREPAKGTYEHCAFNYGWLKGLDFINRYLDGKS